MQLPVYRYRHYTPTGQIPDSEPVLCGVCGARTCVYRNRLGPGSPQAALTGVFPRHDLFLCPQSSQVWHGQVVRIAAEMSKTASETLRALLLKEVQEILSTHREKPCEPSS